MNTGEHARRFYARAAMPCLCSGVAPQPPASCGTPSGQAPASSRKSSVDSRPSEEQQGATEVINITLQYEGDVEGVSGTSAEVQEKTPVSHDTRRVYMPLYSVSPSTLSDSGSSGGGEWGGRGSKNPPPFTVPPTLSRRAIYRNLVTTYRDVMGRCEAYKRVTIFVLANP